MKAVAMKILEVQRRLGVVIKEHTNSFYNNSKYFTINEVIEKLKPILNEVGLVVLQPLTHVNGLPAITLMFIDPETGEHIEDTYLITSCNDAQKSGASVTYWRRYGLVSALLIQGETDDDACGICEPPKGKIVVKQSTQQPGRQVPFKGAKQWSKPEV